MTSNFQNRPQEILITLLLLSFLYVDSFAQYNKSWLAGRTRRTINNSVELEPFNPPPVALFTQNPDGLINTIDSSIKVYMSHYIFTMCNLNGEIQFFTNGLRIYDKLGMTMDNGDSINLCVNSNQPYTPPFYKDRWLQMDTLVGAYSEYFGCSAIPYPDKPNEYFLIYTCSYYDSINNDVIVINYTHIDMNSNHGLGKVISKENKILTGKYLGNPVLYKHGNGRDWWMLTYSSFSNEFYFYFIDLNGINFFNKQKIGPVISGYSSIYQNKISPDGQLFAKIDQCSNISLYSLDRCEGVIKYLNTIKIEYEFESCSFFNKIACEGTPTCIRGIEFSPDSKLLYVVKASDYLLQICLSDYSLVKLYESTTGVQLRQSELLLDDRIYFDNRSGNNKMSILRRPNLKGISADIDYGSYHIESTETTYKIQSFPNYYLGAKKSSVCDTL